LIHPNEYVRGRTLRLLTKLPYVGKLLLHISYIKKYF